MRQPRTTPPSPFPLRLFHHEAKIRGPRPDDGRIHSLGHRARNDYMLPSFFPPWAPGLWWPARPVGSSTVDGAQHLPVPLPSDPIRRAPGTPEAPTVKANHHLPVHHNHRNTHPAGPLGQLLSGLAILGNIFGGKSHPFLRQKLHRQMTGASAGGVKDCDLPHHPPPRSLAGSAPIECTPPSRNCQPFSRQRPRQGARNYPKP